METVDDEDITEIASSREARKFIHVEISKKEFADYMKLKPTSSFVENMFNTADVDNSGSISFREFLDIMVLFTKGMGRVTISCLFLRFVLFENLNGMENVLLISHKDRPPKKSSHM